MVITIIIVVTVLAVAETILTKVYPAHREYKCNICEKNKETESIPIPEICSTCSKITR